MEGRSKYRGLVNDLYHNIRMMQHTGLYILEYHDKDTPTLRMMRRAYSFLTLALLLLGYITVILYLFFESYDVDDYATNTVTVLYFFHSITRSLWFMFNVKKFYRLFDAWNTTNSHPLFAENDAKHHANSLKRQRRLLVQVTCYTVICVLAWAIITFVAEPVRQIPDPENENMTITVEVPQLMLGAVYPWDAKQGIMYVMTFVYQFYWILLALGQANLYDVLLCSFVIYACGQLRHLKEILRPLMELSAALDSAPNSAGIKKGSGSANGFGSRQNLINADMLDMDYRGLFKNDNKGQLIDVTNGLEAMANPGGDGLPAPGVVSTITVGSRSGTPNEKKNGVNGVNGVNGTTQLTSKQELLVRSAIKYWVERHKQLVRYVSYISLAFGGELLIHMLNATIVLTILAYQATKVSEFNVYACCTAGYIIYSMVQIYLFCIYGNEIIEESSTVMEAAYSCHWYDGSEEVKTFVQIVCQQCQKNLVVSGARFFTVSLDLFASVLGATVTYFMVLIQLN